MAKLVSLLAKCTLKAMLMMLPPLSLAGSQHRVRIHAMDRVKIGVALASRKHGCLSGAVLADRASLGLSIWLQHAIDFSRLSWLSFNTAATRSHTVPAYQMCICFSKARRKAVGSPLQTR